MGTDWLAAYFGDDYWRLAGAEYDSDRTAAEVAYLASQLAQHRFDRTRPVLDVGSGLGRHAVPLARQLADVDVQGVDASPAAVAAAVRHAAAAGARAAFEVQDVLAPTWAPGPLGACYLVQSWGWGSDEDQRRLLRRLRAGLAAATANPGMLILDFSNIHWISRNFLAHAEETVDGCRYVFERQMDHTGTRCLGSLTAHDGRGTRRYHHDFRLYSLGEVLAMLDETGFDVVETHAEFSASRRPNIDSRYVQVTARARPFAVRRLAVDRYRDRVSPSPEALDLRWLTDELNFCNPHPDDVWSEVAATAASSEARAYLVDDPWYSAGAAFAYREHLHLANLSPDQVVTGAGTTALLHALGGVAPCGRLVVVGEGHPDLAAWHVAHGGQVVRVDDPGAAAPDGLLAGAAVVQLDRPSVDGEVMSLKAVGRWCRAAAAEGAIVVVDEANANYLPTDDSAAHLLDEHHGLVVLRSLSKGFCCGGLRFGAALCSADVAPLLRRLLPPLQVSSVVALVVPRLLHAGDPLRRLRARVDEVRPQVVAAFAARRLLCSGDRRLPWVFLPLDHASTRVLDEASILATQLGGPATDLRGDRALWRVALPLTAAGLADLMSRL